MENTVGMEKRAKPMDEAQRQTILDSLSKLVVERRKEAVDARKASGIEEVWMQCEESYLGIDDANRAEFKNARWAKPTSMNGPLTAESTRTDPTKSTVFPRLTSRYVDAGAAKLAEILLPVDDKPFAFSSTPVPTMVHDDEDDRPAMTPDGKPIMKPVAAAVGAQPMPAPAGAPMEVNPGQAAQLAPVTIADLAKQVKEKADDCAKRAEKRIYDWMVESDYNGQNRKVIFDAARIGVGILKGPFPQTRSKQAAQMVKGALKIEAIKRTVPAYVWVDPWNCYPDAGCGEDIHDGDYFFERDLLSAGKLRKLKAQEGYIKSQIDKVIAEGPDKCNVEETQAERVNAEERAKKLYTIWYFYGSLSRKELDAANPKLAAGLPADIEYIDAIVTMVNDTAIHAAMNPLESGVFPYDAMPWSRRAGYWAGVGIAEQVAMPQRQMTAAMRAWMNNAGNSSGPQFIMDRQSIEPAQANNWTIHPNKIWFKRPDAQIPDVRAAFMTIDIPNMGAQMLQIIEVAYKLAEESTNIPLVTQGQTGPTTPETLGATELQNNNANTLLRSIGYSYDSHITEPKVRASYEWLLLDPDVPEDEKGDWDINARGSAAMVERAIQDQTLALAAQMALNPVYGANPKKAFAEFIRSKRIDPRILSYTDEEMQKLAETPPPEDKAITVAKINGETAIKVEDMKLQGRGQGEQPAAPEAPDTSLAVAKLKSDTELQKAQMAQDAADRKAQSDREEAALQRAHALEMRRMDLEFKQMELQQAGLTQDKQIQADQMARVDDTKKELAKETINDQTKRELAQQEVELALTLDQAGRAHDVDMNPPSLIRDEMSTGDTP